MDRSLADFPSEVLAEITFHLHGFQILRMLYLTGSGVLWRKLQQCGLSHLTISDALIEESDFQKISTFQGLLSLRVVGHDMNPLVYSSLLSVLPNTLTRLHLIDSFREAKWIRDSFPYDPVYRADVGSDLYHPLVLNLSERFPHLKELDLRGVNLLRDWTTKTLWTPRMTISFLSMLPRNLTSLHMYNLRDSELAYREHVPPHLTKLTTSNLKDRFNRPVDPLPATLQDSLLEYDLKVPKDDAIPALPPHLTSLVLTGFWDRFFQPGAPILPSGLTSLTVSNGQAWTTAGCDAESIQCLPSTLKTLHFEDQYTSCSDAVQWPSQITDLKIMTANPFIHGQNLPKSLKTFYLTRTGLNRDFDFQSLPPSLESLHMSVSIQFGTDLSGPLPNSLTRLAVGLVIPSLLVSSWPPRLQSLRVLASARTSYWTEGAARSLPNTLTHLEISSLPDYIVPHLPSSVTHLQMQDVQITGRISMNYDPQTPSDTAKIPSWLFFDPSCPRTIPHAPSSRGPHQLDPTMCQPFRLTRNMPLHAHLPSGEIMFKTIVRLTHLPPSITSLESNEAVCCDTPDVMSVFVHLKSLVARLDSLAFSSDMTQLTNLQTLVLINVHMDNIPKQLPPSLTHLEFRGMQGKFGKGRSLPTTLRHLNIPSIHIPLLKPLNQLEVLVLEIFHKPWLLQTVPISVTNLSLPEINSGELLPLIKALPHLKILQARFYLKQVELDAFSAQGRALELVGKVLLKKSS